MKIHNILSNIVQLSIDEVPQEALAAVSLNPTIKWIKFVLSDDKANANKQRIPKEEFSNLIKTGLYMPLKMARGTIRDGHELSLPIGTITSLLDAGDHVEGIAALWSREFPKEVDLLKDMAAKNKPPQISWELMYKDSDFDDKGIETFSGTALRAATVVRVPAYEGRTPIVAVASTKLDDIINKVKDEKSLENSEKNLLRLATTIIAEEDDVDANAIKSILSKISKGQKFTDNEVQILSNYLGVTDSSMEEQKIMEELEKLQKEVSSLRDERDSLTTKVSELEEQVTTLTSERDELANTNEELSTFKDTIEAERNREAKIESIRELFSANDVELPEDYFEDEERAEKLLAMDLDQLEFLVQDMAIFASREDDPNNEETASRRKRLGSERDLPNVDRENEDDLTPAEVARRLKEAKKESDK